MFQYKAENEDVHYDALRIQQVTGRIAKSLIVAKLESCQNTSVAKYTHNTMKTIDKQLDVLLIALDVGIEMDKGRIAIIELVDMEKAAVLVLRAEAFTGLE